MTIPVTPHMQNTLPLQPVSIPYCPVSYQQPYFAPYTPNPASHLFLSREPVLCDVTKQLRLQYKLPFLILLATLKRLIVFPSHGLIALSAGDISHYVSSRRHVAFGSITCGYVDDVVEEVGFAVLAAEILSSP